VTALLAVFAIASAVGLARSGEPVDARTVVTTVTIAPAADAFVNLQSPKKRYGTASTLEAGTNPTRTTYIRFDLSGVTGTISRATLSVQAATPSSAGLEVRSTTDGWVERSINAATAPAVGAVSSTSGPFQAGRVALDVTAVVTPGRSGSVALTAPAGAVTMASREAAVGASRPTLTLELTQRVVPAVTITTPSAGASLSDATPTFAGTAGDQPGDSATVTVRLYPGTGTTGTPAATFTAQRSGTTWNVDAPTALADGPYTAVAEQADDSGDVGTSALRPFSIDTVAPSPTLTEPAAGATVTTAQTTFRGAAGDATGDGATVAVEIHAGQTMGGALVDRVTATRSGTTWSVPKALVSGVYTARADQSDAAGNRGESAAVTFTVDAPVQQAGYDDMVLADGPAGYWRLGEATGLTAATQIGASNGTYLGGTALGETGAITGDSDTAVRLDGVNDVVRVPNATALSSSSALTLEAWVRPTALPSGTATLVRKDLQYLVRITGQGGVIFRIWKSGSERELATAGGLLAAGAWSHVVTTYDGATMRIYVNGRARASLSLAAPVDVSTRDLYMGASIDYDWLPARVDEVAVYRSALSATRVQAHYDAAGVIDETPSRVVLETPTAGATWTADVTYGGSGGTDTGDAQSVTVEVFSGSQVAGAPVRTLSASVRSAGTFSVHDETGLPSGTYTARAKQVDGTGNVGMSSAVTFTVDAAAHPRLLAAGDIAACDTFGDEATAELLDGLPGTVAALGDLVYEYASEADYTNCYDPTWGRQRARTRPVPGSHDYAEFQTNAEAYFAYFGDLAGEPAKGYYSYDVGTWHVIALNSNCSKVGGCGTGSAQERWLRADLASSVASCTLAYWHDARFSSGTVHGSNSAYQPFWQALYDYNAEVVLAGHEHVYERFLPQTPSGSPDAVRGLRQFTVGTGGRSHYGFRSSVLATSEVRNADTFGVLSLTLRPGAYDWQFVPEAGRTFTDTGSTTCH